MATQAACGTWKSPITAELVASGSVRFEIQIVLEDNGVYWVENRPSEAGRYVVVRSDSGSTTDITPPPFNARTRVHEYGGGAFLVHEGAVYFSNFADQRIYAQNPGAPPRALTRGENLRFADGVFDQRNHRIICICQDHTESDLKPANSIVAVDADDGNVTTLVSGNDFYSSPRLGRDGSRIAWLTWNHPNMPWDYTELWLADIGDAKVPLHAKRIAGGSNDSICQPRFSPDGILYFVSERTGWWNLYRYAEGRIQAVYPMKAEFGSPAWVFGTSDYAFESETQIICAYRDAGRSSLARLDTSTKTLTPIDFGYSAISAVEARSGQAVVLAGSATEPTSVVYLNLRSGASSVLKRSSQIRLDHGYLSDARDIEFPTTGDRSAHAFYYAPKNADFVSLKDERPPLVVFSHGGPTSAATSTLNLAVQYWTSRGFAVADVNYGGSTGYGREYRQRLDGNWGVVDVDDCINCANYLVKNGLADGARLAIRGGSAGGYTTLAALTFGSTFRAGASYYGVSDLEGLEKDTHKFESRYLERLVGPYPERKDLFVQRSPINHVDRLSCPVIFFQGDEDRIVPPNQAESMADELRRKGLPVAYLLFSGEQHGFRQAKNIKRALEAELYFYSRIFGFTPAEKIDPVQIENMGSQQAC